MPTLFIFNFISLSSIACFLTSSGDKGMFSSIDKGGCYVLQIPFKGSHTYS